jgi:hypothetical protein
MRIVALLILLWTNLSYSVAQSRISITGGWTASKVRAINPNPLSGGYYGSLVNFSFLHYSFQGFEYEYDYKNLRLSTGFSLMVLGAGNLPLFSTLPWTTGYWVIPLLGGYNLQLGKGWGIIFEGGSEVGIATNGQPGAVLQTGGTYWGNINAVVGVELGYKRFRLGVRGHWGLTDFRYFLPITYKHTAITTYLSYDLWDHAKAKARRLQKQQEKQLN